MHYARSSSWGSDAIVLAPTRAVTLFFRYFHVLPSSGALSPKCSMKIQCPSNSWVHRRFAKLSYQLLRTAIKISHGHGVDLILAAGCELHNKSASSVSMSNVFKDRSCFEHYCTFTNTIMNPVGNYIRNCLRKARVVACWLVTMTWKERGKRNNANNEVCLTLLQYEVMISWMQRAKESACAERKVFWYGHMWPWSCISLYCWKSQVVA